MTPSTYTGKIRYIHMACAQLQIDTHQALYQYLGVEGKGLRELSALQLSELCRALATAVSQMPTMSQGSVKAAPKKPYSNYQDPKCIGRLRYICALMYSDPCKTFLGKDLKIDWHKVNTFFETSNRLPKLLPHKKLNQYSYDELGLVVRMLEGMQANNLHSLTIKQ